MVLPETLAGQREADYELARRSATPAAKSKQPVTGTAKANGRPLAEKTSGKPAPRAADKISRGETILRYGLAGDMDGRRGGRLSLEEVDAGNASMEDWSNVWQSIRGRASLSPVGRAIRESPDIGAIRTFNREVFIEPLLRAATDIATAEWMTPDVLNRLPECRASVAGVTEP